MNASFSTLLFCLLFTSFLTAQNTFQRVYSGLEHIQVLGITAGPNGSSILTGIGNNGDGSKLMLSKLDCNGAIEWTNLYNQSSTINNISQNVVRSPGGGYLMIGNIGSFQNYNITAIRVDEDGNTLWQGAMFGSGDDLVNHVTVVEDGYVLAGATNSFGSDDNASSVTYKDVYVLKIDFEGEIKWAKTYGTEETLDEAYSVIGTADGGYALTGRYIENGAFHVFLLKLDPDGDLEFIKTYGEENHRNKGFDLLQMEDGGFVITGSTTLNKEDHTAKPDAFLMKTDAAGTLEWTRTYVPLAYDQSDSGSSLVATENGFAFAMPTMSFYQAGSIVQNKFCIVQTDQMGQLTASNTYTIGYSHYPSLAKGFDEPGYFLSGFSTDNSTTFSPQIIRFDENFEGACAPVDRMNDLIVLNTSFVETTPVVIADEGESWSEVSPGPINELELIQIDLCANIVDSVCIPDPLSVQEDLENGSGFNLNPNPATSEVTISVQLNHAQDVQINWLNQHGQLLRSARKYMNSGSTEMVLDIDFLPSGMYYCQLITKEKVMSQKLVKEK